ncbi:MAG: tetratricopeptide repeat protein [Alphaproteobacteria bacterium]|nr:tetratricopeptide repeat protein [Alphaproteobacteria bacterium]
MSAEAEGFAEAVSAHQAGKMAEAEKGYRQVLASMPEHPDARRMMGLLMAQQGRPAEALAETALAANRPDDPDLHVAVAGALKTGGWLLASIAALHRALALRPDFVEGAYNLGNAEAARGRHDRAASSYARSLVLRPGYTEALNNAGPVLLADGRVSDARRSLACALALEPAHAGAWSNLAVLHQALGGAEMAIVGFRRGLAINPGQSAIHSNLLFTLNYAEGVTDDALYRGFRDWEARHARPLYAEAAPHGNDSDPERRLRVGYLSADFRDHPVAHSLIASFERHDRSQVELTLYATPRSGDAMTERFRRVADRWRWVSGEDERQIAARIRADEIDVLVLVAPHTADNRPKVAALKPAPVQVALYDLSTTGMQAVDVWLTDGEFHPPGSTSERFAETLVRLPCLINFASPARSPPLVRPPSAATGRITFGSFNNPAKVTPSVVALWAQVLHAVPGSRLLMKYLNRFASPEVSQLIRSRFAAHGIAPDRIELRAGRLPRMAQLALLNEIDIALDPFPFNGCTTTFEALWMGVPVVTLAGRRFLGRMSANFLRHLGLGDLVAADSDEYVARAVALAGDVDFRGRLRRELRDRLLASPLCDSEGHARALLRAYRSLWRDWCLASRNQSVIEAHRQS